jgi:hypothetical protein
MIDGSLSVTENARIVLPSLNLVKPEVQVFFPKIPSGLDSHRRAESSHH